MAQDMLMEKRVYPCKAVSVKKLDQWVRDVYGEWENEDLAGLRDFIWEDMPKNIAWQRLRYLRIIGDDRKEPVQRFEAAGIPRGFYLNADGTWLLLILPEKPHLGDYFSRCGEKLESLWIFNSIMYSRDAGKLPGLRELWLRDNPLLESVERLDTLAKLERLLIADCPRLVELPGLEKLTQLTQLDLSHCGNLAGLRGLEKLTQLTQLDLSWCKNLTALPGLEKLTQLTELNLSGCENLTALPGLEKLTQLTELNLSGCRKLTALPEGIRGMQALRRLVLNHMELKELPDWLPEIAEQFTMDYGYWLGEQKAVVMLKGTTVEGVDMSIFAQPHEVILKWFEERKAGRSRPLNEVKVVFLGDGEAGKTHTIARLLKDGEKPDSTDFDGEATPGIVIQNKEYELDGQKIQVHFWDFGGQEILHSMHRMFLTERTLYVVIINARDDTQNDRAKYWLHNIKSFAPGAPVLLVLNKIDQNPNASIDLPGLRKMYEGLRQEVRMSALEYDTEKFNRVFTAALLAQVKALGTHGVLWPASWLNLKTGLETMQTHYIHGVDYEDLCEKSGVEEEREDLLHWFNDLGVSFCYGGSAKLEDYVILKPEWLTNAIYILLFNKCKEAKNGIIPHKAINRMLRKPRKGQEEIRRVLRDVYYDPTEVDYVMDVVRKFRLSYRIREDEEFIPMLCQRETLPVAEEYADDPNTLEFTMEYDYLPDNVIHRLMVEMRNDLDTEKVWRTGARLVQTGTSFSAVVKSEGNLLRIFVRSENPLHKPNTYLHIIKGNIDRINADMKLKAPFCEVIYKNNGIREPFDYEDLLNALKDGETTYRSKKLRRQIPIEDILNQSGRTSEIELDKLRDAIITACMQLQDNKLYWHKSEDEWNTGVRDVLRNKGYIANDQSFQGISGGGKRAGELDIDIRKEPDVPWTVYEALKIRDKGKTDWNAHLKKLLDNYNPSGLNYLFLVTYVDCDRDTFPGIWESFREHIRWHDPDRGNYERLSSSFSEISLEKHGNPNYIRAVKITYDRAGSPTTVCHIFLRMGE